MTNDTDDALAKESVAAITQALCLASDAEVLCYSLLTALIGELPDDPDARLAWAQCQVMVQDRTAGRKTRPAGRVPPTPPSRRLPWPLGPDGEPDPDKAAPRIAAALAIATPEDRATFWASVRHHVANPTDDVHRRRLWRDAHSLVTRAGG